MTLRVSSRALSRLAVILFALPVAVMLIVAWMAAALAPGLGLPPDPTAGVAGLVGLALCCCLVGRRGGRLERTLTLNARLDRDR